MYWLKFVSVCNHKQKLPHTYEVSSFLSDCILVDAKLNIILGMKETKKSLMSNGV